MTVTADRSGGFSGPIALAIAGLPAGVQATVPTIAEPGFKSRDRAQGGREGPRRDDRGNTFAARPRSRGKNGEPHGRAAHRSARSADRTVAVAVAVPTPFKFTASYDQAYTPRGSVQVQALPAAAQRLYAGPLEVRLADKQVPVQAGGQRTDVVVPAGADRFDYPLTFAPFMEILRTSRTNLMATGIITDPDGTAHPVTSHTEHQDEQIVAIVAPGRSDRQPGPCLRGGRTGQVGGHWHSNESGQGTCGRRRGSNWSARRTLPASPPRPLDDRGRPEQPVCCGSPSPTERSVPSTCR